ncbi:MAG TPA: SPOR domain-containing protein [Stellaceae bacterium]|nr:SPOR domain-containing protein [Stellaceae bacterium]
MPPGEEYAAPRSWLPMAALAVGVIGVFAGSLWFAYHEGAKHAATVAVASTSTPAIAGPPAPAASPANVPLIHASAEPVKIKPEKAGGMSIPNKDDPLYAMRNGVNRTEHILPPPESPQPRPAAPPPPPSRELAETLAPSAAYPPPKPAPQQVAPEKRAPAKLAEGAKPATNGPAVKIQLASLRTPDEAREEWQRLKHDNADLLGKFTAVAVKADLGDRGTWYRVEAGPVGDKAAALKLCKALRERDLGCHLVK